MYSVGRHRGKLEDNVHKQLLAFLRTFNTCRMRVCVVFRMIMAVCPTIQNNEETMVTLQVHMSSLSVSVVTSLTIVRHAHTRTSPPSAVRRAGPQHRVRGGAQGLRAKRFVVQEPGGHGQGASQRPAGAQREEGAHG